jgi:cobalt-zinc-cadmium resistance protein CzcA
MQISRENGMRRVVVEANVRGRDLGGFVSDAQASLAPLWKELPAGYFVELGGQFENQQRAMRQLAIVVPTVLLLILFLLYSALGSASNAIIVLLNLPVALVGGVVAAVAFRMSLSVSAAVALSSSSASPCRTVSCWSRSSLSCASAASRSARRSPRDAGCASSRCS